MQQITEQQIAAMAPNAAAAANGRKISQKGGFVRLERSGDDTFYLGECTGSGKSNYITTADFIEPGAPVMRCSCPSRQFPCKHGLALLYEIMENKPFGECAIPDDILKKRERKQNRDGKAEENVNQEESGGSGSSKAVKKAAKGAGKAARTKKLNKQLEGLELTGRLIQDLLRSGLGSMGGTALDTYRQLSKQLGDYYLPGPQKLLNRLTAEIEGFQKDGLEEHYDEAVELLKRLWALTKKARTYLEAKLKSGAVELDADPLYEELGGIYKLSELEGLGLSRENVRLTQLAFWVTCDETAKQYIDTGCWADQDTGEISMTFNYRPFKALKYIKQDDSLFGTAHIPLAVYYPGEGNRRVRWEGAEYRSLDSRELLGLRTLASPDLAGEVKSAKNYLKNILAAPMLVRLIRFEKIMMTKDGPVLTVESGDSVLLGDIPGMEETVYRLELLPDASLFEQNVLLGGFYYDRRMRRILIKPLSILTPDTVVRLLY